MQTTARCLYQLILSVRPDFAPPAGLNTKVEQMFSCTLPSCWEDVERREKRLRGGGGGRGGRGRPEGGAPGGVPSRRGTKPAAAGLVSGWVGSAPERVPSRRWAYSMEKNNYRSEFIAYKIFNLVAMECCMLRRGSRRRNEALNRYP
ncbi:unnamed protein product [Prorocentrum cordatum]|uniref:Uncharacterized protein n=1 Tax=Prorocentrum cordatum TaxID=2364126 RepID=A0ABN9XTE1_9DINO|nr:unnamed protein product [Polarella glacialis]